MAIKSIIKIAGHLSALWLLAGLSSGCMRDSLDGCVRDCVIHVRAYDASGRELTGMEVTSVNLYLFDANYRYTAAYETELGETIKLQTRPGEELHIVAWGNLGDNSQARIGEVAGDSFVELLSATKAEPLPTTADDLFHGILTIRGEGQNEERDLPIFRKMGSLTVTVQNLKSFADSGTGDYSIVVRETCSAIRFDGTLSGNKTSYRPDGGFVVHRNRENYYVPAFNLLPEENGLAIDIYEGAECITTVSQDSQDEPIIVREGLLTNVLISLGATSVSVNVIMTDWGSELIWKEY